MRPRCGCLPSRTGGAAQGTRLLAGTSRARAIRSRFRRVQLRSPRSHPATYDQLRPDLSATASSVRPASRRASRTLRPNSTRSGFLALLSGGSLGVMERCSGRSRRGWERSGSAQSSVDERRRDGQDPNPHIDTKGHPHGDARTQRTSAEIAPAARAEAQQEAARGAVQALENAAGRLSDRCLMAVLRPP